MTRLDTKCLIASAGCHALLVTLICLAPLLWARRQTPTLTFQTLDFVPSRLVNGAMSSGGKPDAKPPAAETPAPPAPAPITAPPAQPKPKPVTIKEPSRIPQDDPEPAPKPKNKSPDPIVTDKPLPIAHPDENSEGGDSKSKKQKFQPDLVRASNKDRADREAHAETDAQAQARAAYNQRAQRIGSILGAIGHGVSSGTSIDIPGPGGEAYADYGQFVSAKYKEAWNPPPDLADDSAMVEATVVIRRDGTVESFRVTKLSGHAALDKTVARLEKVRFIAPFPEGARDERRIFIVEFDLRSKKSF